MKLTSMRRVGALVATMALASGALAATATSAHAVPGPTGVVTGTVLNPAGAAVPGAYVSFRKGGDTPEAGDDFNQYAYVEDNGTFTQALPPGTYSVNVYDDCEIYEGVSTTIAVAANVEQGLNPQFTTQVSPLPTSICARVYPEVTGVAQVGKPLAVSSGTYAQAVTSVTYQWRTGYGDQGIIPGATSPTYVPTANELGNIFAEVKVTSATDSRSYEAYPEDSVKRGDYLFRSQPKVLGLPVLGKTIAASPGSVAPGASVSYQWFSNGKALAGQTARTHRVSKADYQKKLSAVITYKTYGYGTITRTVKAPFAAKKKAKLSAKVTTGKKQATFTIKISPSASKKAKGKITISENGKTLKRVSVKSGTVKVKVSKLKKGKHKLTVVYEGKKNAAGTSKTVRIKK
ncbi:carboxypeptidase-like regulatory domain-containing protein [Aeromicrobium wangtongii]|uniref:alpha-amylase n=1 Tax=Aeromicrobium wangtongii TaxID=2969247 RepID=A0ABY5MAC7_9ACTN|nr:carboxypeptidase-like regulatory domain-containing protein [Aeromicrobium wangtongii]MCD9200001.1 carboxypeptidase-like regulatory domain-containing protein [Aeromicrobium wangtongii]UUP13618.1 carboxypeptidase-like regulatory domain-containing protein [Aeromicrobium wangtongii]